MLLSSPSLEAVEAPISKMTAASVDPVFSASHASSAIKEVSIFLQSAVREFMALALRA